MQFNLLCILSCFILESRGTSGAGERGNNANRFLLRMANLLIFIHNGGIQKLLYGPDLKMVLIIWAWPKQSNRDGLFWFKVATGTQYART